MLILKNKPIINVFSKQYPVGQGGLHLSVIECFHPFTLELISKQAYIYDCGGTTSTIEYEINNFFNDIYQFYFLYKLERLDNLYIFISHLHQDHCNGLQYLKNYIQRNPISKTKPRLMLPYMTETEMDI